MEEQMNTPAHVSFSEAFRVWTKIGFLSFGGPAGQIGLMHKMLVMTESGSAMTVSFTP